MDKIKKFLQEIPCLLKLRGKKRKSEDTVENKKYEEDEYEEMQMEEDDKKPGSLKLNDGEHNPVYGINNKVITGTVLAVVILAGIMFYTKYSETAKQQMQDSQPKLRNEEAFDSNRVKNKNNVSDYEALAKSGKAKAEQGKMQPVHASRATDNTIDSNNVRPPQSTNVPAMQQAPISAPYMLPSNYYAMQQQPQSAQVTIQKEEDKEPSIADRFQSAISFAISATQSPSHTENMQSQNAGVNKADFTTASYYGGSATILQAGTIIPAMLFTGINTDVAGQVTAQVQSDVYDSITGLNLLIPGGSKLIGTYDTKAIESGRVNVTFSIIVLPNGSSYNVGNTLVATDGAGYAGISGKVNRHTERVLGGGMAASALAALGSFASGNTRSDTSTYTGGQLAMQGAVGNLMNNASKIFESSNNIEATVVIDPGYEFNVYVAQPVSF